MSRDCGAHFDFESSVRSFAVRAVAAHMQRPLRHDGEFHYWKLPPRATWPSSFLREHRLSIGRVLNQALQRKTSASAALNAWSAAAWFNELMLRLSQQLDTDTTPAGIPPP